jgi:hypothetical protein
MYYIGIVRNGRLKLIFPQSIFSQVVDLTRISMVDAADPFSTQNKVDLSSYEGRIMTAQGYPLSGSEDLIYDAKLLDIEQPLPTEMVSEVFDQCSEKLS